MEIISAPKISQRWCVVNIPVCTKTLNVMVNANVGLVLIGIGKTMAFWNSPHRLKIETEVNIILIMHTPTYAYMYAVGCVIYLIIRMCACVFKCICF